MTRAVLLVPCLAVACGCSTRDASTACVPAAGAPPLSIAAGTGLVVATSMDYDASVLDALCLAEPRGVARERLLLDGSSVVRRIGDRAAVLFRSAGSSLLVVQGDLAPGRQVSLGDCNPHDVEMLDDTRALLTCFGRTTMVIVDLADGSVTEGPDLSRFADADGRPEMDHLARAGERVYVTLELLGVDFEPTGPGQVAVLDAGTLALVDVDESATGVQAFTVCKNPFTDLAVRPDGQLVVGCLGSLSAPGEGAVVALDPKTGRLTWLATGAELGGPPSAVRLDAAGVPYVLHWSPTVLEATEMRLVRLDGGRVEPLYLSPIDGPTDQGLSGLAVARDGTVLVGDRSGDGAAGVWLIDPGTLAAEGPLRTTLPPLEIEVF